MHTCGFKNGGLICWDFLQQSLYAKTLVSVAKKAVSLHEYWMKLGTTHVNRRPKMQNHQIERIASVRLLNITSDHHPRSAKLFRCVNLVGTRSCVALH